MIEMSCLAYESTEVSTGALRWKLGMDLFLPFLLLYSGQLSRISIDSEVLKLTIEQISVVTEFAIFDIRKIRTCDLLENKPFTYFLILT